MKYLWILIAPGARPQNHVRMELLEQDGMCIADEQGPRVPEPITVVIYRAMQQGFTPSQVLERPS